MHHAYLLAIVGSSCTPSYDGSVEDRTVDLFRRDNGAVLGGKSAHWMDDVVSATPVVVCTLSSVPRSAFEITLFDRAGVAQPTDRGLQNRASDSWAYETRRCPACGIRTAQVVVRQLPWKR